MGADNWAICPKCKWKEKNKSFVLAELYGKIPFEEYEKRRKEKPKELDTTLREDYEFYWTEEGLCISYSGTCEVCDYEYTFGKVCTASMDFNK